MIIVRLMGGMGNQMFQYALGKQLSIKHNTSLKFDLSCLLDRTPKPNFTFRNYDLDIFRINVPSATEKDIALFNPNNLKQNILQRIERKLKKAYVAHEKYFQYDPSILNAPANCYLSGYWQTEKYFLKIKDLIKENLSLNSTGWDDIKEIENKILSSNSVCINFRRADFINNPEANKFHGVQEMDYYTKAVEIVANKIKQPVFFIFSDEIDWCRQNVKITFPHYFIDHKYAGKKFEKYLYLMISCKNFIIPNSTFAWWAAWLSDHQDKLIIAPKKWFNDTTINTSDLIPPTWIRI